MHRTCSVHFHMLLLVFSFCSAIPTDSIRLQHSHSSLAVFHLFRLPLRRSRSLRQPSAGSAASSSYSRLFPSTIIFYAVSLYSLFHSIRFSSLIFFIRLSSLCSYSIIAVLCAFSVVVEFFFSSIRSVCLEHCVIIIILFLF